VCIGWVGKKMELKWIIIFQPSWKENGTKMDKIFPILLERKWN
jgi:hypothetical protein